MRNTMSTNLITQTFGGCEIRILAIREQPWFLAADVCRVLDMNLRGGTAQWTRHLADDERMVVSRRDYPDLVSGKGAPQFSVISESGLYKLAMRSDKPEAKAFQDWVTRVVLPAIRKDGMYVAGEERISTGEMNEDEFILKVFTLLQSKVERLAGENAQLRAETAHLTVDEFRALKHAYWSKPFKSLIGRTASGIYRGRGLTPAKQQRIYRERDGVERITEVNVYERPVLEEALSKIGSMAGGVPSPIQPV